MAPTRWGIVSAGKISSDFTTALTTLPKEDHQIIAVAARDLSRAEKFAENFDIPKAYGSYKELAINTDVDVIYVGAINIFHFEICEMMINAGKNVLCETPLTMNARQTKAITALAKEKGMFLMEGYWSCFFPIYKHLRNEISTIGTVKMVQVNFGVSLMHLENITTKKLGGGSLMSLGCYNIMFALLAFQSFPERVSAEGIINDDGVDEGAFITLHFSGNRIAQLNAHISITLDQTAHIYGTKGMIKVPNFWSPDSLVAGDKQFHHPLSKYPKPIATNFPHSEGLAYEAEAVRHSILKGEKENPLVTHQDSINISLVIDEIRRQIGIVFKEDKEN